MLQAGMNVARLNFSHGDLKEHAEIIKNIRESAAALNMQIPIIQDLPGVKFRVHNVGTDGIEVSEDEMVILTPKKFIHEEYKVIPISLDGFETSVKAGHSILFGDGMIEFKVTKREGANLICKVKNSGTILGGQGINIPDLKSDRSVVTEEDIENIAFGVKHNVDFIALSFVRSADDVQRFREVIAKEDKKYKHGDTRIIAKIEKQEALHNIDDIVEIADGIMIARGDLGVETRLDQLPIVQKKIIQKCLNASKPVITATQMLLSMVKNPRPTRSETSDVANAVVDHTDAVMLSEETARGKYPVEAVATMARIIRETERSPFDDLDPETDLILDRHLETAVGETATRLARRIKAKAIFVASLSGGTARIISKFRIETKIIASTHSEKVERQMQLSWGVVPLHLPVCDSVDELISVGTREIRKRNLIQQGERIIIVAGHPVGESGNINMIKIHNMGE
jgi:pyruvate kinase